MEQNTIKPVAGLRLRKIGNQYMIVKVCSDNVNMSHVFSLNETAAQLWEQLTASATTPAGLAQWLCASYQVDEATALQDVNRQLEEWQKFGLIH